MSDSNQIIIYVGQEGNYAESRDSITELFKLGVTSISLKKTRSAHASGELREDRNVADFRLGTTEVSGDISCELAFPEINFGDGSMYGLGRLFCSAMRRGNGNYINPYSASTISAVASDNSLNDSANNMPLVEAGDTILISDSTVVPGNNGYATVVSRTESKIVVSGKTLANASAESVTITPKTIIFTPGRREDGWTSFAVDRRFDDVTLVDPFHYFSGCNVNSMNVKVPSDGLCTATFSVMGQDMTEHDVIADGGSYADSAAGRPTDGYSGTVTIDGTENATITELDFTLNNNMAARHVIGTPLTQNHTLGQVNITGTMTAFFGSDATDLLGKFLNEEPVALRKTIIDPDGNKIEFRFPRIFFTGGAADSNGVSGEVTSSYPFQAVYDATAGYALQIRFNRKLTA